MELEKLNIPTSKLNQFKSKGINSLEELVKYLPSSYVDYRNPLLVHQVLDGVSTSILVTISYIYPGDKNGCVRIKVVDAMGSPIFITWFNNKYIRKFLTVGNNYIVCGKININVEYNSIQILNPMYISEDIEKYKKIMPTYPKIKGMTFEYLKDSINTALELIGDLEYLDEEIIKKFNLQNETKALYNIHNPIGTDDILNAKRRFVFDTLFQCQFQLEEKDINRKSTTNIKIEHFKETTTLLRNLPFKLTADQNEVMKKISNQMKAGKLVNALICGDVGSGKSCVAFLALTIISENGYQGVLLAPTSVLAKQHYIELKGLLAETNIKVCFLGGKLKAKEKKLILSGIKSGEYNIIVGTHSVIQKSVEYNNLGLVVVDEEHRFGVNQRDVLIKRTLNIHSLSMSATPIPRSLAMTMYGDAIQVLTIASLPSGRKPVKTAIITDKTKAYKFMQEQIRQGHQCYFVCPLIEKSYAEAMESVDAVEEIYEEMLKFFEYTEIKIAMITGKMKEDEVDEQITKFKNNEIQIIIATTVIEVGINIPNATVIAINNAERFGLAQLHQLRGRVGRGSVQSYCALISEKKSERLDVMVSTNNGFEIAEKDLQIRGSGDLLGSDQSGQNQFIDLMLSYPNLFKKIKVEVKRIFEGQHKYKNYKDKIVV